MEGWEALRVELRRLVEEAPGALVVWQDPDSARRSKKRVRIELAAWATDIAGELHAAYGDLLDLRVGAKLFPGGELVHEHLQLVRGEPAEAAGLVVEAPAPLAVRSGWDARCDVRVTNRTPETQVLITNGEVSSVIVDGSGRVVGRFVGPHPLPRVGFEVGPYQSRPVPILIGTAVVVPDLEYAVPPGQWTLVAVLATESGDVLRASLELVVTP